jgi:hypothetical protein
LQITDQLRVADQQLQIEGQGMDRGFCLGEVVERRPSRIDRLYDAVAGRACIGLTVDRVLPIETAKARAFGR